jgi:hypothetical protein
MPLTMRPSALRSGMDKARAEYTIYSGRWDVGRVHEIAADPTVCAVLVDDLQRPDATIEPRGNLGGG